ncbi:unnamed protein product [Rangifer tarandus platyrhynchus]|uniref:Uncharacterized protein n=2 Tax=Rangifer tarandus platyrhynchus TaxID=3082113 RepID=A0ABN8Z6Z1_RANTA|nr:unnamed protein product [Rangifer tarandus platyrhynchus]CAI9703879.1 unnamed protein product [Rangifer tarandus platyrhynchus]
MRLSERNKRQRATSASQPTRASAGRQKVEPDRTAPSIEQIENRQLSSGDANCYFSRGFRLGRRGKGRARLKREEEREAAARYVPRRLCAPLASSGVF